METLVLEFSEIEDFAVTDVETRAILKYTKLIKLLLKFNRWLCISAKYR